MKNFLNLIVEDFGSIRKADININKINVVGGVNASGKSTLSKLLFSFLYPTSAESKILSNNSIKQNFQRIINLISDLDLSNQLSDILNEWDDGETREKYYLDFLLKFKNSCNEFNYMDKNLDFNFSSLENLIHDINNPNFRITNMIDFLFKSEFNYSQTPIFNQNSNVIFKDNNNTNFFNKLDFTNNILNINIGSLDYLKLYRYNNICYMDSISVLESFKGNKTYHFNLLKNKLLTSADSFLYDSELDKNILKFEEEITNLISGNFEYDEDKRNFVFKSNNGVYDLKNVASGFKQLGILQLLLNNKNLGNNSFLFIDEPEINLHPNFQIILVEILVKLVKYLDINLYINSHSPYIIDAFEVFTEYYDLDDDINFFLSEESHIKGKYNIYGIEKRYLDEVYDNLANSFDRLNKLKLEVDLRRGNL